MPSFTYCLFLYWLAGKRSIKIKFLLIASYFFYSFWDWRFLFLLAFSTFLDYFTGLKIFHAGSQNKKKMWLFISVFVNLGFLGFFKYYNFFIESFAVLLQSLGLRPHFSSLNIILPVGISFYTFHGLSYVFDIYNKKIKPTTNWINYTLFVSFFPLSLPIPLKGNSPITPS